MSKQEYVPASSPYSWAAGNALSVAEFLGKYRPSMVENDGTKPWLWVRGGKLQEDAASVAGELIAIAEASVYLEEVTKRIEDIKNDSSIPIRSSKKTGTKSKKEVREALQAEAAEKLKEIAVRTGYVNGKWLIFASPERIDKIWTAVATSIVSGPLSNTPAYLTKVATPPGKNPNYQHVICIYIPDVYDQAAVTEVMRVLLRNHGLNLSGVKSDLYTVLGVDSKHPSGIPSTIWKNSTLMKDTEMKALKDEYFAELTAKKATPPPPPPVANGEPSSTNDMGDPMLPIKPKFKLKKKVADDPFASDNEDEAAKTKTKKDTESNAKPPFKIASEVESKEGEIKRGPVGSSSKKKKKEDEMIAGDLDEEEEGIEGGGGGKTLKTKTKVFQKKEKASIGRKVDSNKTPKPETHSSEDGEGNNDNDGETEEQRPKRKRVAKRSLEVHDEEEEDEDEDEDEDEAEKFRPKKRRTVKKS